MTETHPLMQAALEQADAAAACGEVPIGCVVADADGHILARAHNRTLTNTDPTAHAEILALRAAAGAVGNHRLRDLTLVVTVEPCAMCAGAIGHARIGTLVWGAPSPLYGAVENGVRYFDAQTGQNRPHTIVGHVREADCAARMQAFFRDRRPPA